MRAVLVDAIEMPTLLMLNLTIRVSCFVMYVCMYVCVRACICMYVCMYVCMYHACACVWYVCTYVQIVFLLDKTLLGNFRYYLIRKIICGFILIRNCVCMCVCAYTVYVHNVW